MILALNCIAVGVTADKLLPSIYVTFAFKA